MAPESRGGGGSLSRRAAIALIGGGGLLGLSGTGAFTQVDGSRPFSVATATDANALLAVEGFDEDETYNSPHTVTLENQLSKTLDNNNTVSIENGNLKFESGGQSLEMETLDPGDEDSFKLVIPNKEDGEDDVEVSSKITILYKGSGTTVEITRQITITSDNSTEEDSSTGFNPSSCADVIKNINNGGGMCEIHTSGDSLPSPGKNDLNGSVCHKGDGSDPSLDNNGRSINGFLYVQGSNVDVTIKKDVYGAVVLYANGSGDADLTLNGKHTIHGDVCIEANNDVNVNLKGNSQIKGSLKIAADGNVDVDNSGTIGGSLNEEAARRIDEGL